MKPATSDTGPSDTLIARGMIPEDLARAASTSLKDSVRAANLPDAQAEIEGFGIVGLKHATDEQLRTRHIRLLDPHLHSKEVRAVTEHPGLAGAAQALLGCDAELLQSLGVVHPPEEHLHRDEEFVRLPHAAELVGVWVYLEPVGVDQGPVIFYPGSSKVVSRTFAEASLAPRSERTEHASHEERWAMSLTQDCERNGLGERLLVGAAGDSLAFRSRVATGGAIARDPGLTRVSLLIHFIAQGTM